MENDGVIPEAGRGAKAEFPSDIDLLKNPSLGELKQPDEDPLCKSFLAHKKPYYDGGFRILHCCPEFRLIQDYGPDGPIRVEWNCNIYRLCLKSMLQTNSVSSSGDETWKARVSLACGLDSLRTFYGSNKGVLDGLKYTDQHYVEEKYPRKLEGGDWCARTLGATWGAELNKALEASDTEQAIKDLTASFGVALRAIARAGGKLKDKRRGDGPKPHDLIRAATEIFREYKTRPAKKAVKFLLTDHYGFKVAKKKAADTWADLFINAGLGDLP